MTSPLKTSQTSSRTTVSSMVTNTSSPTLNASTPPLQLKPTSPHRPYSPITFQYPPSLRTSHSPWINYNVASTSEMSHQSSRLYGIHHKRTILYPLPTSNPSSILETLPPLTSPNDPPYPSPYPIILEMSCMSTYCMGPIPPMAASSMRCISSIERRDTSQSILLQTSAPIFLNSSKHIAVTWTKHQKKLSVTVIDDYSRKRSNLG